MQRTESRSVRKQTICNEKRYHKHTSHRSRIAPCQTAGGIEDGEKAWEAALREVGEETGLICDRLYSPDICEQFYQVDRDAIRMLPVFVSFVDAEAAAMINDEHSEFRWVPFEADLGMVPSAGQRHILKHVQAEFAQRRPVRHVLVHEALHKS